MEERFWPFDVLPLDQRTPLHQQQIAFLEAAYREGFRPFAFGGDNFQAAVGHRTGVIFKRTRQFWEICLSSTDNERLAAYVAGFDVNADAVLKRLWGEEISEILEFVRPNLIAAGGRSGGFVIKTTDGEAG